VRRAEGTPLVIGKVMYMSTSYNRVVALEPETGKKLWEYESAPTPAMPGIAYYPRNQTLPPEIVFGTLDGFLISLNAEASRCRDSGKRAW
jgi:quinoprotein glucose dehydrogenase